MYKEGLMFIIKRVVVASAWSPGARSARFIHWCVYWMSPACMLAHILIFTIIVIMQVHNYGMISEHKWNVHAEKPVPLYPIKLGRRRRASSAMLVKCSNWVRETCNTVDTYHQQIHHYGAREAYVLKVMFIINSFINMFYTQTNVYIQNTYINEMLWAI